MLTIRKPKVETTTTQPLVSEHNMDAVYLEGAHTIVHVSGAITGDELYTFLSCLTGLKKILMNFKFRLGCKLRNLQES